MCEFKFCAGAHACFLKNISPCPRSVELERTANENAPVGLAGPRVASRGFLDRDQLIVALGLDENSDAPPEPAKLGRIATKLQLAAAYMGQRAAS